MKILVADDNEKNLYMLEVLLKGAGYEVVTARNGIEALSKLRAGRFDGIVSDILMPEMDGFRLIRECRKDPGLCQIPFIFYTATYTEKKDEVFGLSLGAIRYLIKPAEPEELIRQIHEAFLDHARSPRDYTIEPVPDEVTFMRGYTQRVGAKLETKARLLEESEEKYRTILENIQDAFYRSDNGGNLIMVSPSGASLLGYNSSDEMLGFSIAGRFYANPDDRAALLEAIKEKGFVRDYEINLRRKDGSVVMASTTSHYYYNPDGSIAGVEGILRDITDRKQAEDALKLSERRLSDLVNFLPDATFAIDKAGRIITWNRAMEEMTGTKAGDMLGKGDHEYAIPFYGERRPILIDLIFEDIQTVESRYVHVQRSGNVLVAEASVPGTYQGRGAYLWGIATPLYDNEGNIVGAIESIRDITDRKMAQDALARATKKLNLLNSITFNDIQNGIYSLTGYLQLQHQGSMDEKLQQYLNKQTVILQKISESLKFASTYQGLGLKPPAWQNVQQSFLLGISHTDISKLSRTLNVEGLEIYADPLLEKVFFTLAENIILHGKTATAVSLSYRETDNGLVLVFEDNGEGIPSGMKEKIFERKDVGTKGLDLFLASEILSITGITIKETGEPGKGARFEIAVPKGAYRLTGAT